MIEHLAMAFIFVGGLMIGFDRGRRARHETIVTYHPVDLQAKLAAIAPAFRGHQLIGTRFELHHNADEGVDAHLAVQRLILLAVSTPAPAKSTPE